MSLKKYTKEQLIKYGKEGWNIIHCNDVSDVNNVVSILDKSRMNNIPGYITNREGVDIYFVLILKPVGDSIDNHTVMIVKKSHRGRPKKTNNTLIKLDDTKSSKPKIKRGRPRKEVK